MTYELTKKNIKSLTLRVDKNGVIKVSAPRRVDKEYIDSFVAKHSEWIAKKRDKIPKYADGEAIWYFNEKYILDVRIGDKNSVYESQNLFGEKTLEITLKTMDSANQMAQIKKIIFKWYRQKSQNLINEIIAKHKSTINREVSHISLREMTSKWGSCNYKSARISLNVALFARPQICFEYVLCHELAHLLHPNHGSGFYAVLGELMPNWREIKSILKG
ncbi:M48 family metallopeptidase [Helicobacter sp. 23-1044]